jgi:hypothetical protein
MRLKNTLAVSAFLLFCVACGSGKPDFSGTWVQASGPPTPGVPNDPDLEPRITVKQEGSTLSSQVAVISRSNPSKNFTGGVAKFQLDGSERRDASGTVSRTYWEGDTLVFATNRFRDAQLASTNTVVWSMDRNGMLVIEHTLTTPGQSKPARMKTVHKKVP